MEQIALIKDDQVIDLQTANILGLDIEDGVKHILYDDSEESLNIIRHSTAHLMAQAIKLIYPKAQFFVGPTIEDGFYYDFKACEEIHESDLKIIEKKMQELIKKKYDITKYSISKTDALEKYKDDELKLAVLKNIPDNDVTFYVQGDFEDLCRGPHVPKITYLRWFKLLRVAGAYLGGDENNEMITRIYGTAFSSKESLKNHITFLEEAKKRDHRRLGTDLKLFKFDEDVGAGLPIWLPNGARLRYKLEQILYKAHKIRGYDPVRAPEILKSDMWEISGHYQNYGENMYLTNVDGQEYGLKPMNCLGHIKIYQSELRSYKDLPIKMFEYGVVHRHEKSGVLNGLLRVREFTQDDAHIFCMPNQIKDEILDILEFVDSIMKTFGFDYSMELATKPTKAIGDDKVWDIATEAIRDALDNTGHKYGIDEGGGAFYGPKIDIKITDALKRKWQCATIQVDFNLPERFGITYTNSDDDKVQPVMIHRAILGSFERFIAILIEHYSGEFPFFIAPIQIIFIPIRDEHNDYAKKLSKKLLAYDIDSKIYNNSDSLNKRIRNAEKQRVPMIIVIGDEEVKNSSVAIRDRRDRTQSSMLEIEFFEYIEKINKVNI